ncbi:MAG: ribonuclease H [Hyperionvirus sp.]|uniref:ribonuclease H n=1 Tax=Hyperionvirus sp. TaxID=2487770 RepID=A0A3G5ABJ2_9VIRU|nr:MAG: ribonuclease H [Hyperionvirus sp.]
MGEKKVVGEISVFTDGSFMKHGGDESDLAGYGIYFPNKELPDISRPFRRGKKTNQRAELFAIYVALVVIKKNLEYNKIKIYTDSEYSIKAVTLWVKQWRRNNWKTSQGKDVLNQDIIQPIDQILDQQREKVIFIHVRAHTGFNDEISICNSVADKLAHDGALRGERKKLKI